MLRILTLCHGHNILRLCLLDLSFCETKVTRRFVVRKKEKKNQFLLVGNRVQSETTT